jgi:hypothetical protein
MNLNEIKLEVLPETLRIGKISDQEYFSKKYSAYVSNSRLGSINPEQGGSPEKFFNPMGGIYSDSIILGSACHEIYLQPEYFELVQIERPNAKLGFVCDYIWEHFREISDAAIIEASQVIDYYKDSLTDKKIAAVREAYDSYYKERITYKEKEGIEPMFLSPKLYETAVNSIQACNNNQAFTKIMHPDYLIEEPVSENEQAFTVDFKCSFPDKDPIVIKWKSKLDNYVIDFESNTITVNDLKTIGAIVSKFDGESGNFGRFHYYREFFIYIYLLKLYVGQKYNLKNPKITANALVVSTIPGNYTKVYEVTNKEIKKGLDEFKYLMRLVAYYIAYEGYGLD